MQGKQNSSCSRVPDPDEVHGPMPLWPRNERPRGSRPEKQSIVTSTIPLKLLSECYFKFRESPYGLFASGTCLNELPVFKHIMKNMNAGVRHARPSMPHPEGSSPNSTCLSRTAYLSYGVWKTVMCWECYDVNLGCVPFPIRVFYLFPAAKEPQLGIETWRMAGRL